MEKRDHVAALSQLQSLKQSDQKTFINNNYDYLAGRLAGKTGNNALAMSFLSETARRRSPLKAYALWHLSLIARDSGNKVLERLYLQQLKAFVPGSLLSEAVRERIAWNLFKSGDMSGTVRLLERVPKIPLQQANLKTNEQRDDLGLLGEAYMLAGNVAKAREIFARLIASSDAGQVDDLALRATIGLDELDVGNSNADTVGELSADEHFRRANVYQFNREFARARVHLNAIVNKFPGSAKIPEALLQIGRGYAQEGNFPDAVNLFERVLEQYPNEPAAKDALLQAASAYAAVAKRRVAIARYQRFIELYPDDENVYRTYLNIIDVLRDNREDIEAVKRAAAMQKNFRGQVPEALALFAEARTHLSRTEWQNALDRLTQLQAMPTLGNGMPGGTSRSEVTFLRAFALEQLRRYAEAVDEYLAVPNGRNEFYGGLADQRLSALASHDTAGPVISSKLAELSRAVKDPDQARRNTQGAIRLIVDPEQRSRKLAELKSLYAKLPEYKTSHTFKMLKFGRQKPVTAAAPLSLSHKAIADELLFLQVYDEGAPELEAHLREKPATASLNANTEYSLAVYHVRGDHAERGPAFVASYWKAQPDHQEELIPFEVLELLYPAPYREALRRHTTPRNVDPRFLLAIMRQESGYRPTAKSDAAARGLMQFIPSTANKIAGQVGREVSQYDDLYDPSTSILFGSEYVMDLFKLFPQQPAAVAAAYNGGEDNMQKWIGRSRSADAGRYVPEIRFWQTKDYVHRVMANLRMYERLYNEQLEKRSP